MGVYLKPGTRAAETYGLDQATENYYCNFGLNPQYRQELEDAGLVVAGMDQDGEARILELPTHTFYLGTLFVPQARSVKGNPHPLVLAFVKAAARLSA
jgi:CTP synthase (UTP-ammonia lyase)